MADLLKSLPELVAEGLITAEQAERIRGRYATPDDQRSGRMTLLLSILGALLIGLGILLVVAHNWDQLGRTARTVLAFVPLAIGQAAVVYTLLRCPQVRGWREGSATFLLLAVGACLALIGQIYHLPDDLSAFLLTWSVLVALLIYVPGSLTAMLLYIGLVTWYAVAVRGEHWSTSERPWMALPLLAVVVPAYVREARERGTGVGFFWSSLFLGSAVGIVSQLFWEDGHVAIALGIVALAIAYRLVPWLHVGRPLRTSPIAFIGGAAILGTLFFLSYRLVWAEALRDGDTLGPDLVPLLVLLAIGAGAYLWSLRVRRPFEGTWFPESMWLVALAYAIGQFAPAFAALMINAWLFVLGLVTVREGLQRDSLPRMNLGLGIISLTIVLRFFDLDINDAVKGMVFIALGIGFLVMNLRLVAQRRERNHA